MRLSERLVLLCVGISWLFIGQSCTPKKAISLPNHPPASVLINTNFTSQSLNERVLVCTKLTKKDLTTDSPYNTYTNKGLPPTPIGSPSLDAIEAALHPTKNNYLYYLADKDGVTHFSKTYDEHLQKKYLYLGT